ncbi:MAG: hypothetical protein Fur0034_16640 [Desulfuromonadia bacterium]
MGVERVVMRAYEPCLPFERREIWSICKESQFTREPEMPEIDPAVVIHPDMMKVIEYDGKILFRFLFSGNERTGT